MEECYFSCNYAKSNTPPWFFLTFSKLYKWYQIAQRITYVTRYWLLNLPVPIQDKEKS